MTKFILIMFPKWEASMRAAALKRARTATRDGEETCVFDTREQALAWAMAQPWAASHEVRVCPISAV